MTLCARMFPVVPLAAAFLLLISVSAAPAQDSMQLDVEFKESLTRGSLNEEGKSAPRPRSEARAAQARVREGKFKSRKHIEASR